MAHLPQCLPRPLRCLHYLLHFCQSLFLPTRGVGRRPGTRGRVEKHATLPSQFSQHSGNIQRDPQRNGLYAADGADHHFVPHADGLGQEDPAGISVLGGVLVLSWIRHAADCSKGQASGCYLYVSRQNPITPLPFPPLLCKISPLFIIQS